MAASERKGSLAGAVKSTGGVVRPGGRGSRSAAGAVRAPRDAASGSAPVEEPAEPRLTIRIEMPQTQQQAAPGVQLPRPTAAHQERMTKLLGKLARSGGSDLLVKSGYPPYMRVDGELTPLSEPAISDRDLLACVASVSRESEMVRFLSTGDCDLSVSVGGVARFRVNLFTTDLKPAMAVRVIPTRVPTLAELGVPPAVTRAARETQGLLLVTGPTGSGKSTTLASILGFINDERPCHILTLEDPIEFIHSDRRAIVTQRELGTDLATAADGIRFAQRQDADVILIGELRDLEMLQAAMLAAGAGKLVLATLHTSSAAKAVERLLSMYPQEEQAQARMRLAMTLLGIISQTLVHRRTGGRVAAFEMLMCNAPVRKAIRDNRAQVLYALMESGRADGMVTLEQALAGLTSSAVITRDEALARAADPEVLLQILQS